VTAFADAMIKHGRDTYGTITRNEVIYNTKGFEFYG
jgi:hypothetical protein